MGKQHEGIGWLLIKFALILQLYHFHHQYTAEATGNHFEKNVQNGEGSLNLNDRMSKAEFQIRYQGGDISVLKTTVHESMKIINQLNDRLTDLGASVVINNKAANDEVILERQKRPYRLIPVGKEGKYSEEKIPERFYGPPTNCNDLEKIGYTLNGFYLVNGEDQSNSAFEAVFCRFKQAQELKYAKEDRFRLFDGNVNLNELKSSTTMQPKENENEQTRDLVTKPTTTITTVQHAVTSKTPFFCNNDSIQTFFHLKNDDRNTCMGLKGGEKNFYIMENLFIRWKCDNRAELFWAKDPIPHHKISDGSIRLCHSSADKCLDAERKFITREYRVRISHYDPNRQSQKWKIVGKTGQLINVEAQLCLTSYSNSKILTNENNKLVYGLETCSDDQKYIIAQQKWSLVQIPSCDDDKR